MVNNINYATWSEEDLDTEVVNACSSENYDLVKYLLNAQEQKQVCDFADHNTYFYMVCSNGDLKMAQWFVDNFSHELSSEDNKGKAFLEACQYDHVEIVNYLLNNETVKNIGDFSKYKEKGFQTACENENIEIINYLLHDSIKRNHSIMNPNSILDKELKIGLYYAALNNSHSMTELFIIDWNIQFDKGIEHYLDNLSGVNNIKIEAKDTIKNLYEKRELYKKLHNDIDNIENNTIVIKKKI